MYLNRYNGVLFYIQVHITFFGLRLPVWEMLRYFFKIIASLFFSTASSCTDTSPERAWLDFTTWEHWDWSNVMLYSAGALSNPRETTSRQSDRNSSYAFMAWTTFSPSTSRKLSSRLSDSPEAKKKIRKEPCKGFQWGQLRTD